MEGSNRLTVKTALISVFDKTGIVEMAQLLAAGNVRILSTGGTASELRDAGINVTDVSEYTGFPEILDGRVKTLHPKVHGGILGRRDVHADEMAAHEIEGIDLVIVNLYPFESVVADSPGDLDNAIEHIDIGGPSLVRAAAKNYHWTCAVVDPADYVAVGQEIRLTEGISASTRISLAAKAFSRISEYDSAIADYLAALLREDRKFPAELSLKMIKAMTLRYGENPHQAAALYRIRNDSARSFLNPVQMQGKAMSFNNMSDADAAIECVRDFNEYVCVIVKHANPCGVASDEDLAAAYSRAFETDTASAFGGVIAFNRKVCQSTARKIIDNQFVEVIAAPEFDREALKVLAAKKNTRVLRFKQRLPEMANDWMLSSVSGGVLIQDRDALSEADETFETVTERSPSEIETEDLLFAWKIVKHVKSNAIVFAANKASIGIGAGQASRVDAARIAVRKAKESGLDTEGLVMASDAFMPFPDTLEVAVEFGVKAVIQPGGSIGDRDVIDFANRYGVAMVFTGIRHFRH